MLRPQAALVPRLGGLFPHTVTVVSLGGIRDQSCWGSLVIEAVVMELFLGEMEQRPLSFAGGHTDPHV